MIQNNNEIDKCPAILTKTKRKEYTWGITINPTDIKV